MQISKSTGTGSAGQVLFSSTRPSLSTTRSPCYKQTRADCSRQAMSVGAALLEPHSHYRFPPFSHQRRTLRISNPPNLLAEQDPSLQSSPWQFHQLYGENHHPSANMASANMASANVDEME